VRPRPDAMRPKPKENCEAEARDVTSVIIIPYINACAPTYNVSTPRNHTPYDSHNNVNALFKS